MTSAPFLPVAMTRQSTLVLRGETVTLELFPRYISTETLPKILKVYLQAKIYHQIDKNHLNLKF